MDLIGKKNIEQTTSTFAYIYIKGLLLYNWEKVLETNMINMNGKIKMKDGIKFLELIRDIENNKKFSIYLENEMKEYGVKIATIENNFIAKTLRMTCYELII